MIQDLPGSWCIKGSDESTLVTESSVPLMHHDADRSWITDPDPDHPKGNHPKLVSRRGKSAGADSYRFPPFCGNRSDISQLLRISKKGT